jgi:hypothetical protein
MLPPLHLKLNGGKAAAREIFEGTKYINNYIVGPWFRRSSGQSGAAEPDHP